MRIRHLTAIIIAVSMLFVTCKDEHTGYAVVDGKVIYRYTGEWYRQLYASGNYKRQMDVVGADTLTFDILNRLYAKDVNSVFYKGKKVDRDVESFRILNRNVTIDKNTAYFDSEKMEGSDGLSFKILGYYYALDTNQVYYTESHRYSVIEGANSASFELVKQKESDKYTNYGKDDKQVYFEGEIVEVADVTTFRAFGNFYYKDSINIYSKGEQISSKELEFKLLNFYYASDNQSVFYRGAKIDEANPATFQILRKGYSKDDKNVFYEEYKMQVDYDTFKAGIFRVKDKNGYYRGLERVSKI